MRSLRSCSTICVLITFLVTVASPVTAQTPNPRWLSDMPAPERILRELKGKDPEDTIERQMGAFQHLMEIIDNLAYGLEHRYLPVKATPDENRLKEIYGKAYADLWYKAKNKENDYIHDRELHRELLDKFFTPGLRELYLKADKNSNVFREKLRKESEGVVFGVGAKDQPGTVALAKTRIC